MQTINDWEEIPGIDKVIEHAKRSSVAAYSLDKRHLLQHCGRETLLCI